MSETSVTVSDQPKRSPAYPALDLQSAIERVRALYASEKRHPAPIATAVKHWGYRGPNGRTNGIIGALKQYGLVVDQGSGPNRKIQVTDAAVRILEHPLESERIEAIRKAALLPRIHSEMWAKHRGDPPSDDTWAWELREDRNFTETGAAEFVKEYKATIAFAGLTDSASSGEEDVSSEADEPNDQEQLADVEESVGRQDGSSHTGRPLGGRGHAKPSLSNLRSVELPMPDGGTIILQGAFPITERQWSFFKVVLDAMKDGLVEDPTSANPPTNRDAGEAVGDS